MLLVISLVGLLTGCGVDNAQTFIGDGVSGSFGLTTAIGGILGALARLRGWRVWVGAVMFPVAAIGVLLADSSLLADARLFLYTLIVLSNLGIGAFLIVGSGNTSWNGGLGNGGGEVGGGGFGGGGRFGGGASGSW